MIYLPSKTMELAALRAAAHSPRVGPLSDGVFSIAARATLVLLGGGDLAEKVSDLPTAPLEAAKARGARAMVVAAL